LATALNVKQFLKSQTAGLMIATLFVLKNAIYATVPKVVKMKKFLVESFVELQNH